MTTTIPESRTVTCDCCSKEIKPDMPSYSLAVPVQKREEALPGNSQAGYIPAIYRFRCVWERKELDFCSPACFYQFVNNAEFLQTEKHFKPAGVPVGASWAPGAGWVGSLTSSPL